jgi:hypothetical protein
MVASSLFIFSVGFFIYAVSPAYAKTEKTNVTAKTNNVTDEYVIEANGYLYKWSSYDYMTYWVNGDANYNNRGVNIYDPKRRKLPL